jgi:hypothetical protein
VPDWTTPVRCLFAFETLNRIRLPAKIEPGDHQIFLYSINASFPKGDLGVITADNRERFCSRSEIRAIHGDEAYKKFHATNDKKARAINRWRLRNVRRALRRNRHG